MSTVVLFIVIMDVLKYFFGIEPTYDRPVKPVRRPQRRLMVVQRFVYVHDSTTHPSE